MFSAPLCHEPSIRIGDGNPPMPLTVVPLFRY
jgi:hypothetical protein